MASWLPVGPARDAKMFLETREENEEEEQHHRVRRCRRKSSSEVTNLCQNFKIYQQTIIKPCQSNNNSLKININGEPTSDRLKLIGKLFDCTSSQPADSVRVNQQKIGMEGTCLKTSEEISYNSNLKYAPNRNNNKLKNPSSLMMMSKFYPNLPQHCLQILNNSEEYFSNLWRSSSLWRYLKLSTENKNEPHRTPQTEHHPAVLLHSDPRTPTHIGEECRATGSSQRMYKRKQTWRRDAPGYFSSSSSSCSATTSLLYLLLLSILSLILCAPLACAEGHQSYRTAYGCEGASLSITCDPGHVINVIRANYGRFSITICNDHGNTEWSVNCQSRQSNKVLIDQCSHRNHCKVGVSSATFGDPCPGTFKYIEVQYSCTIATTTTTTARPRPAWDVYSSRPPLFLPPSLNASINPTTLKQPVQTTTTTTTLKPTTLTTTTLIPASSKADINDRNDNILPSSSTTSKPDKEKAVKVDNVDSEDIEENNSAAVLDDTAFDRNRNDNQRNPALPSTTATKFPTSPVFTTTTTLEPDIDGRMQNPASKPTPSRTVSNNNYDVPWCPPSFGRGLYWNWTRGGDVAVQSCPGGATGWARRKCHPSGWSGPADLGECRSAWLTALEKRANSQDAVLSVADDLATVTANKALYGGDLTTAARLISTLARRMTQDISDFPDPRQKQAVVTELLATALSTASSLLAAGMGGPWGDLAPRERRHAVTQLMVGLEEATFLLADALPRDSQAAYYDSHVLASARVVTADGSFVHFPSVEDQSLDWTFADHVILPPEAIIDNSERSAAKAVFLTYRHLEDLLMPFEETLGSWSRNNVSRMVNSRIVSASLGHGRHIQLPKPVTIIFSLLRVVNVSNPVCAFWDYTTASWSDEGCKVVGYNGSHVTCQCDHLTNFAVLMEKQASVAVPSANQSLRILAYIGCIICLVCLAGSLIMFTLFRGLSSPCSAIHHQLCMCLLVAELVFVIGIWRTDLPVLCGIVAGVLYYAVLAAFTWVSLEGVQLYMSVARAVEYTSLRLRWWHYAVAYGLPLLIVSAAAVIDPFSFGTQEYCWLRTDNYFVFALVGPALVLLVIHISLLVAALIHTCKLSPDDPLKSKEMARLASSKVWLRGSTTLLVLMVLTWSFGLLYLHRPSMPVAVTFCVLNSLHGVFVLVYYCVRNQKFLPRLCRQLTGVKGQGSSTQAQPSGPLISGHTSTLGSRASLRQGPVTNMTPNSGGYQARTLGPANFNSNTSSIIQSPYPQLDTNSRLHQSLPRHHHHNRSSALKGLQQQQGLDISTTTPIITASTATTPQAHNSTLTITTQHQQQQQHGVSAAYSAAALLSANDEDISYKSFSRDSGHGGSEQEDSPRTHWTNTTHHPHQLHHPAHHQGRYTNSYSTDLKGNYMSKFNRLNATEVARLNADNGNNLHVAVSSAYPYIEGVNKQTVTVPNSYTTALNPALSAVLKNAAGRGVSPWNHTYMEIEQHEIDPVYEEIERERWGRINGNSSEIMQVSDLSDEDGKQRTTPSDMSSRQSSRSYGDSRPLLPYYNQQHQQQLRQQQTQYYQQQQQQHQEQQQQQITALNEERLREFNAAQMMSQELQQLQQQHNLSRENLMTVAVLNGEQVVCRLTSPSHHQTPHQLQSVTAPAATTTTSLSSPSSGQYQQLPLNTGGGVGSNSCSSSSSSVAEGGNAGSSAATSPASNGCPAHIVISRGPTHQIIPMQGQQTSSQQQVYNEC